MAAIWVWSVVCSGETAVVLLLYIFVEVYLKFWLRFGSLHLWSELIDILKSLCRLFNKTEPNMKAPVWLHYVTYIAPDLSSRILLVPQRLGRVCLKICANLNFVLFFVHYVTAHWLNLYLGCGRVTDVSWKTSFHPEGWQYSYDVLLFTYFHVMKEFFMWVVWCHCKLCRDPPEELVLSGLKIQPEPWLTTAQRSSVLHPFHLHKPLLFFNIFLSLFFFFLNSYHVPPGQKQTESGSPKSKGVQRC